MATRRIIRKISGFASDAVALAKQVRALAEDISALVDMAPTRTVLARVATGVGAIQRIPISELGAFVEVQDDGDEVGTQPALNFIAGTGIDLTVTDNAADTRVDVTIALEDTAVTPGSYTNADVTVDQQGRITAVASGSAGGVTDGDKGDITVSGGGTNWQIDAGAVDTTELADDAVTVAKLDNGSALSVLGRAANSSGDRADIQATAGTYGTLRETGSTLAFVRESFQALSVVGGGSTDYDVTISLNATALNHVDGTEIEWTHSELKNGMRGTLIITNDSDTEPGTFPVPSFEVVGGTLEFIDESGFADAFDDSPNGITVLEWYFDGSKLYMTMGNVVAAATGGGGGASATTVEVALGALATQGKFTITDAAIASTSKVMCWQAPGPYTGKGTRADEAEMQPVQVVAVEAATGSAVVKWQTPPMLTVTDSMASGRLNTASLTTGNQLPFDTVPRRIGKVGGNVKFSYVVF